MAQPGALERVLGAPPELLPLPGACCGALIGLPQRCGPRPGCARALRVLRWHRAHAVGLLSTGHPHHTSSVPLAPLQTTPSPPRSEVQLSVCRGGLPSALFIVVAADPAHGAPSARPQHPATGHRPPATGHGSFSSVPPSCSCNAPDGPGFYFPCKPGEEQLRVPCPPLTGSHGFAGSRLCLPGVNRCSRRPVGERSGRYLPSASALMYLPVLPREQIQIKRHKQVKL